MKNEGGYNIPIVLEWKFLLQTWGWGLGLSGPVKWMMSL